MYLKKNWLSMVQKEPFRRRFDGYEQVLCTIYGLM